MGWKTGALVGLKHAVAEGVLLRQLKIGLHVGRHHILKLRVARRRAVHGGRRAGNRDQVRTIHFSVVIHFQKTSVGVPGIVVVRRTPGVSQIQWREGDLLSERVFANIDDIRAARNENVVLKKVVGCPVFLEDDDDVLNLRRGRRRRRRDGCDRARAPSTTGIEPQQEGGTEH